MLKFLWPGLIWASIILFLSAHPQMGVSPRHWLIQPDKIAHAGAYALLAFLLRYGLPRPFWPVVIGTAYGILIEFLQQAFFYGRQLDLGDMVANGIGCLIGVGLFPYFAHYLPLRRK